MMGTTTTAICGAATKTSIHGRTVASRYKGSVALVSQRLAAFDETVRVPCRHNLAGSWGYPGWLTLSYIEMTGSKLLKTVFREPQESTDPAAPCVALLYGLLGT